MKKNCPVAAMQRAVSPRLALEPRIVFDGAVAATGADVVDHHGDHPAYVPPVVRMAAPETVQDAAAPAVVSNVPPAKGVEITFVDSRVQSITPYLAGRAGEVIILNAGQDGVDQIAAVLAGRTDIAAVHIISHGRAGELELGSATLNCASMAARYAADMAVIRLSLTPNADVLLYGCDVASGASGVAFIANLAQLTGADIQASTDATGAVQLGGNWRLEAQVGKIEAQALDAATWAGLLATPVAKADTKFAIEDQTLTISAALGVLSNDTDADANDTKAVTSFKVAGDATTYLAGQTASIAGKGTFRLNADGGYVFTPLANSNGVLPVVTYSMRDTANNTASATLTITVAAAEDAPVNTVPANATVGEDTNLVFSVANGNALSISDVDGGFQTVTLSINSGNLSLSGLAGLTFTAGDGSDDATMTFRGTIVDINNALNGLTYKPGVPDYNNTSTVAGTTPTITIKTVNDKAVANDFVNGGFESFEYIAPPGISTYVITNADNIPGYDTTATDNNIEVWGTNFQGVGARQGNYFAELNATQASTLFHTFQPPAGAMLELGFSHRGRAGVDVAKVQVIDLGADGVVGGTGVNADTVLASQIATDGKTAWGDYVLVVPGVASGNVLRISFSAVSSATGNGSVGNFLDAISMSQTSSKTNSFSINVTPVKDTAGDAVTTLEGAAISFNPILGTNGASADNFEGATPQITKINGIALTPGGAAVVVADGLVALGAGNLLTFTPSPHFNGAVPTFTYSVASPVGVEEIGVVNVTVISVNDAPAGTDATLTATEDVPRTFTAADFGFTDLQDNPANFFQSVVITSLPTAGAIFFNGVALTAPQEFTVAQLSLLTFKAAPNANGAAYSTLTFQVRDNAGVANGGVDLDQSANTLSFNVVAVNDAPFNTAPAATQNATEDTAVAIAGVRVGDVDSPMLTTTVTVANGVARVSAFAGATVVGNNSGTVTISGTTAAINGALAGLNYTGSRDYNGPAALTIATSDGTATSTDIVNIAVAPAADITADAVTTSEDTAITFNVITGTNGATADSFSSPGRQITSLTQPAVGQGSVSFAADGTVVYTPALNFNGRAQFTYTVTSGGVTETATVTVNVTPVNDNPAARPDTASTPEDMAVTLSAAALLGNDSDVEGNTLGIISVQDPINGTVMLVSGAVVFTPDANYNGPASFTYTVADGQGGLATATVNVLVIPVDDPVTASLTPDASSDTGVIGDSLTSNASAALSGTGAPGDMATLYAANGTTVLGTAVVTAGGTWRIEPVGSYLAEGVNSLTVRSTDPAGNQGAATAVRLTLDTTAPSAPTVVITDDANRDGLISASELSKRANARIDLPVDAKAGDTLTVTDGQVTNSVVLTAAQITAGSATSSFANPPDGGVVSLTASITDAAGNIGASRPAEIVKIDTAPTTARPDAFAAPRLTALVIDVATLLSNDRGAQGTPLRVTSVQGAVGGSVVIVNGKVVFTPAVGFNGLATFTYSVADRTGGVATALVSIAVSSEDPRIADEARPLDRPVSSPPAPVISMEPALHVLYSVNDVRGHTGLRAGLGLFQTDGASAAELAAESALALDNLPEFAASDALYVQHAVRNEALVSAPGLFVQASVRASQLESLARHIRVDSFNSASSSVSTLLDPFATGAPSDVSAAPVFAVTVGELHTAPPLPPGHAASTAAVKPSAAVKATPTQAVTDELPAPPAKRFAAEGFAAQLRRNAVGFRAPALRPDKPTNSAVQVN